MQLVHTHTTHSRMSEWMMMKMKMKISLCGAVKTLQNAWYAFSFTTPAHPLTSLVLYNPPGLPGLRIYTTVDQ